MSGRGSGRAGKTKMVIMLNDATREGLNSVPLPFCSVLAET